MKNVYEYLLKRIKEDGAIHLCLIDPDEQSCERAVEIGVEAEKNGSTAIMVGGSGVDQLSTDNCLKSLKGKIKIPLIIFPGNISSISGHADAIFFMSMLNSRSRYWLSLAHAFGSFTVKNYGLEPIPMGYLIIDCGKKTSVEFYGDANTIPRDKPQIAAAFALAAQYMGMKLIYLEGGSGAEYSTPTKMVSAVKKTVNVPVIVGGGIRTGVEAAEKVRAGADMIVTGTVTETGDAGKKIKELVDAIKKAGKEKK